MTVNILKIPDQYFFVWDRKRHEAALNGLKLAERIKSEDTEESRDRLHELLIPSVGFREAEKLRDENPDIVRDALEPVRERQIQMKAYLEERFDRAIKESKPKYREDFGETEVDRDSVFFTLSRSSTILISEALGKHEDWEKISGKISCGESLDNYLEPEIVENVINLLPYALVLRKHRDKMMNRLRQYMNREDLERLEKKLPKLINLPEEANEIIEMYIRSETRFETEFNQLASRLGLSNTTEELKKQLEKVVKGPARLARTLNGLRFGRVDRRVLPASYYTRRSRELAALAEEIRKIELKEYEMEHVHTMNSRLRNSLDAYLYGKKGISTKLLEYLGIEDVSSWHNNNTKIFDPVLEPDLETLGLYVGHLLFGNSHVTSSHGSFFPKNKGREWFLDLIERIGKIETDLSIEEEKADDIGNRTGRQVKNPDRIIERYVYPVQILRLAEYSLERCSNREFYEAALRSWMEDRGYKGNGNVRVVGMKRSYKEDIMKMATSTGIEMKETRRSNKRSRYVRIMNPEAIGYTV